VSDTATTGLQTLAFGELEAGLWGCVWADGAGGTAALGSLDASSEASTGAVAVSGSSAADDWALTGPDWGSGDGQLSLTVAAASPPASSSALPGFEQLCRVRGRAAFGGGEHEINCLGVRTARPGLDLSRLDSVREVSAWFEGEQALALTALRPRGAAGHERDAVSAAVFDPERVSDVEDPRLSTTYGRDGLPLRAGLELWLASEVGEDGKDGEERQFPRRAAGEALGAGTSLSRPGLELLARPLRWHSRGLEGAGLYLLARAG
jgi:hypothetical protein